MSVAMLIDNPNGTPESYAALRDAMEVDGPIGGVLHLAGPSPHGGWRVIEIFDSVEDASGFLRDRFQPALASLGFSGPPPKPEFWPVESLLTAPTASSTG